MRVLIVHRYRYWHLVIPFMNWCRMLACFDDAKRVLRRRWHQMCRPTSFNMSCTGNDVFWYPYSPCHFPFRECKFKGTKVPPIVLSLPGEKVCGNESKSYCLRTVFEVLLHIRILFCNINKLLLFMLLFWLFSLSRWGIFQILVRFRASSHWQISTGWYDQLM